MAKIPENVLNVLGECRADGNLLYLPSVQLDRKTYTEVNKVLENMGGKWNRKAKAHVFAEDDDVAEMLENVLLTQEVKDLKREYQHKADTAFQNYQETGITRYDTARRNNEDMAEALRMAASAKEDHDRMIHLRGVLSQLAWRAAEANRASEEERPRKMQTVLGELLSAARMQGLIRDEGGDFK